MPYALKLIILLFFCLVYSSLINCQEIKSVRYKVIPNAYLDLIEGNSELKLMLEKRIENSLAKYVDFILVENDFIQIYWGYQGDLQGVQVFTSNKVYEVSNENKLTNIEVTTEFVDFKFRRVESQNDSVYTYEITSKNAMPLIFVLKDSLPTNYSIGNENYFNFPEAAIVMDHLIFPEKIIYGNPEILISYHKDEVLICNDIKRSNSYLKFIKHIKSKRKRNKFLKSIYSEF